MALESTTTIAGLNSTNPTSSDTIGQADNHIRLIKTVLKTTFPNFSGPITATNTEVDAYATRLTSAETTITSHTNSLATLIPAGIIAMWSGLNSAIPTGWVLCDGQNSTPDLRNRFIVGSGSSYTTGNTGGANSVTSGSAGAHNHSGVTGSTAITEAQLPTHVHTVTIDDAGETSQNYGTTSGNVAVSTGSVANTVNTSGIGSGLGHDHTITAELGHTHTVDTLPLYYALAFIMKT